MNQTKINRGLSGWIFAAVIAVSCSGILNSGTASAAPLDLITPAGLAYGQPFRFVFATSTTHDAISDDLSIYDSFVTTRAAAGGLTTYNGSPVTWQALISTNAVDAIDRLPSTASALFLVDGTRLADSGTDLWDGFLDAPINISEFGTLTSNLVHTGSNTSGLLWAGNRGVGSPDGIVVIGSTNGANSQWTEINDATTDAQFAFYAFSSELTFVPEPSTYALLLAGAGILLCRRCRKERPVAEV